MRSAIPNSATTCKQREVQQLVVNCMIWMFAAKAASAFIGKHLQGEGDRIDCAIIGQTPCFCAPTQLLSRKDGTVRTLDDYFIAGISRADFRLIAPNTVETEVWGDKSVPASVKPDALPLLRSLRKSKPFSIDCARGRVFKPDEP